MNAASFIRQFPHALFVHIFGVKVDAAVPFNGIEGNTHAFKPIHVLDPLKDPEFKNRLHVEHPFFTIVEDKKEGMVISRDYFFYAWVHCHPPY
jgi:hypothetical protein